MTLFFLIINVILFSLAILSIVFLVALLILKKYNLIGYTLNFLFIAMIVINMLLSWNIVFMNLTKGLKPFEVNYYIDGNYDITIIFFVIYLIVFVGLHFILKYKLMKKDINVFSAIFRFLLPALLILCYTLATIILIFSFNYYLYLIKMF